MEKPTCGSCPFFAEYGPDHPAYCYLNPPLPFCECEDNWYWEHPIMEAEQFCGQHPDMKDWLEWRREQRDMA